MSDYCREARYGRIKFKVEKEPEHPTLKTFRPNFIVLDSEILEDTQCYMSDGSPAGHRIDEEIGQMSLDWLIYEQVNELLKDKAIGDQVWITGDVHIEDSKSLTDCGYEYDSYTWLDEITVKDVKRRKRKNNL